MKKIETEEQLTEAIQKSSPVLLLKHSLTCPISADAFAEYKQYAEENRDVETYYLAVQDARSLSNQIAETYQIKHESPQALLFSNNSVVWNASHRKITVQSLKEAIQENA